MTDPDKDDVFKLKRHMCVCVCAHVLTCAGVHTEPPYTQVAQQELAKTHKPPKQHFHLDPASSATCTEK